ncbi:SpoIIE family protein phosphatase [Streptomyces sp. NPDC090306]|uniref:SpoIIE family protein phosphatase n=1 Tax=unclassified Streptomyces TaxID=2593676 RepID=UPI0036F08CED
MTPTGTPVLLDCEDVALFRDRYDAARGAAAALGRRVGLGEQRTSQLVLAVAELTTNLTKHAVDGFLLLRALRNEAAAGVEVLAVDGGPGMTDVPAALRDGMSTIGTLGIGLGAVQRLADAFAVHSLPGMGTVQLARFWPRPPQPFMVTEPLVGGITRPISGEQVCGDAWAARVDPAGRTSHLPPAPSSGGTQRTPYGHASPAPAARPPRSAPVLASVVGPGPGVLVMSCDGLGHGPMAATAAQAAVHAFRTEAARTPEQAMENVHRALRKTRGAAVAVARLEPDGRLLFCGVGNITAALVTGTARTTLVSHPGIVGQQMRHLRTYEHHLPAGGILAMHSDGISGRWRHTDLASFLHHPPALIAAALLRLAGTRRDDASAVIAKAML